MLIVSDGLGSAAHSDVAAEIVCDVVMAGVFAHQERNPDDPPIADQINGWMELAIAEMVARAMTLDVPSAEFACTLLLAAVCPAWSCFAQVGDGAIVFATRDTSDEWQWVFWPEGGEEYINETACIRPGFPLPELKIKSGITDVDEIAVFSDGLQGMALHYASQTVHSPFFVPLFAPLRASTETGISTSLSQGLAGLLAQGEFDQRTDDDRTLVIATRRSAPDSA